MLPCSGEGKIVRATRQNLRQNIVGVENCSLGYRLESVGTEAHDVRVGSYENSNVAMESPNLSDRIRNIVIVEVFLSVKSYKRNRQVAFQRLRHTNRTRSRASTTVRSREGLVKIQVDNVETHVAGSDLSQQRVEVCPVVVEQAARLMDYLCDFENVLLEDSQSVRIRNHKSGRVRTR